MPQSDRQNDLAMLDAAIGRVESALADESVAAEDREKLRKELAILKGMRDEIAKGTYSNRVC